MKANHELLGIRWKHDLHFAQKRISIQVDTLDARSRKEYT